jgi:hypothetical protein
MSTSGFFKQGVDVSVDGLSELYNLAISAASYSSGGGKAREDFIDKLNNPEDYLDAAASVIDIHNLLLSR